MRTFPDAGELLRAAEATLKDQVADELPPGQRYNVAMVIAAIRIAVREMSGGPSAWPDELSVLQALYGAGEGADEDLLKRLNRRLAEDLRRGVLEIDGELPDQVRKLLVEDVMARLNEDNPRYVR